MSPVCSQPVDDGLGGLVGLLEVPLEDVAAAGDDLAVVGDRDLHAGDRLTDVAGLVAQWRPRHRAGRLGHAVDLRQLDPDRVEPLEDLGRQRRSAGDRQLDRVEPDQPRTAANATASRKAQVSSCSWVAVPAELGPVDLDRGRDAVVELLLLLGIGRRAPR